MKGVEAALLRGDEMLARRAMLTARETIAFLRPRVRELGDMMDRVG